jgi:Zn-dependent protease with chaperone function
MLVYSAPLLLIILQVTTKRLNSYAKDVQLIRKFKLTGNNKEFRLYELCRVIADCFDAAKPDIVLVPSKLPIIATKYIGAPYFRSYILLSQGCLNMKEAELAALLAHEIYHVKRHTFKWYLLNLLSDYTLFGTGFLAITTNSYAYELEADYHAAIWAKRMGSVSDFINALQKLALVASTTRRKVNGLGLKTINNVATEIEEYQKKSFLVKLGKNINLLFQIYFGDKILSYIHPPLELRIERITAIAKMQAEA